MPLLLRELLKRLCSSIFASITHNDTNKSYVLQMLGHALTSNNSFCWNTTYINFISCYELFLYGNRNFGSQTLCAIAWFKIPEPKRLGSAGFYHTKFVQYFSPANLMALSHIKPEDHYSCWHWASLLGKIAVLIIINTTQSVFWSSQGV